MYINLRELALSGLPVDIRGRLNAEDAAIGRNDMALAGPVEANLTAHYDAGMAVVSGTLTAELELICSRCLRKVTQKAEYSVTEMFTLERSISERDEDIHLVREERVDLTPYLREAFAVQLPMAAVCGDACRGLCPVCGKDRNTESCGCVQERLDPRFAGLKDLFPS